MPSGALERLRCREEGCEDVKDTCTVARGFLALFVFLATYTITTPALAQSFLGTIRGTVVDPQGSVVPGAAVLIIDEATGVPRAVETDAEGRYEATNLRPGTLPGRGRDDELQEVRENGRSPACCRHRAGGRHPGRRAASTRRSPSRPMQSTTSRSTARPSSRGLDEQQLHDLPRNSRDIQSFLLLNPNVVGGSRRHPVPGRQDLRRLVHPGRPGVDERHLRHHRQLRSWPRRDFGDDRAVELLQCRVPVAWRASW